MCYKTQYLLIAALLPHVYLYYLIRSDRMLKVVCIRVG